MDFDASQITVLTMNEHEHSHESHQATFELNPPIHADERLRSTVEVKFNVATNTGEKIALARG
jgi:hypothetical protein